MRKSQVTELNQAIDRPISLLSVFNRLFERLMHKRLTSFIEKKKDFLYNPLSPNIHKQILQTDLYTFPYRIIWEKLIKDQRFFSL